MNIDEHFLRFPSVLSNDIEGLIYTYPQKFPEIVGEYKKMAKRLCSDPHGFREYGNRQREELGIGVKKILNKYEEGDKDDLAFLVDIDTQLHRLYCFRFWIVNYLFPDGPLHDVYVGEIKRLSAKLADFEGLSTEQYEQGVQDMERLLLQSDYADLYLQNALSGVTLIKIMTEFDKPYLEELRRKIQQKEDEKTIYHFLDPLIDDIYSCSSAYSRALADSLKVMIEQAEFRKTRAPLYHVIIHSIEFERENKHLQERQEKIKENIEEIFIRANKNLTTDEYERLQTSYAMVRNFTEYKDIMGDIDSILLPFWFELLGQVSSLLQKKYPDDANYFKSAPYGVGGMFYLFGWFLPDALKVKVYTPDKNSFSIDEI